MLRKIFVLCSTLAAAAAGLFLWRNRDELGAEIERIRGERRAGLRTPPSARHGAPKVAAGSAVNGADPGAVGRPSEAAAQPPRPAQGPRRVPSETLGAARDPADRFASAGSGTEAGSPEARVTPLASDGSPAAGDACCLAHTRSGKRCSRPPEPGSHYCWQHDPGN